MKISSIPQIYRNMNRLTEVFSVLSKYGLADWLSQLNFDFAKGFLKDRQGEDLARQTREARIRQALAELGPTYIKLGQLLSTRPDLVGVQLADELAKLQTRVPADSAEQVRESVAGELGQPVDEIFAEFDDQPMASASIGQVHRARLKTGELVVVKVQHHGIQETVRNDLEVLAAIAQLVQRLPEFAPYRPVETVAEFSRTLRRELDFGREERNLLHFSARTAGSTHIRIPQPYSELCTSRVLTMELLEGLPLTDIAQLKQAGFDLEEVARRGAEFYLDTVFSDGYFHADPHPGNLLLQPGNVIALLDFGMVGRIDECLREQIEDMLFAIIQHDSNRLTDLVVRIGHPPHGLNDAALRSDVTDFVTHYASQPLERLSLASALTEMTEMMFRYRISLPPQVAMLLKVLITLEGTGKRLSPEFSLIELLQPFHRKALLRRLSPARRIRRMRRLYQEVEHLVEILPRRIMDILEQVQEGKFDVHLDHRGLGPSVNRLVLGMLASALFMGSALMLSRQVPPLLFRTPEPSYLGMQNISLFGLLGCATSVLLGLRLLQAIGKSGHLDRKD